jgi:PAS domain S-box-containing protein
MNVQQIQLYSSLLQLIGWMAPVIVVVILLFRINIRYGIGIGGARVISGGVAMFLVLLFKAFWQYHVGGEHGIFPEVSHIVLLIGGGLVFLGMLQLVDNIMSGTAAAEVRREKKKIWSTLLLLAFICTASDIALAVFRQTPAALLVDYMLYNVNISIIACIYMSLGMLRFAQIVRIPRWFPWLYYTAGAVMLAKGAARTLEMEFQLTPDMYVWLRASLALVMAAAGSVAMAIGYAGARRLVPKLRMAIIKDSIIRYKVNVQKRFVLVLAISIVVIGGTGFVILEVIESGKHSVENTYLNDQRKVAESVAANMESINNSMLATLRALAQDPSTQEIRTDRMRQAFSQSFAVWKNVVSTISRTDEHGILRYTYPEVPGSVGADISSQPHVKRFLATRDTVFTGVFKSVQGPYAFGMYVPVYAPNRGGKGTHFAGGVALLVHIDAYALRAFRNSSIFTPNPLAAINSYGKVIVTSRDRRAGIGAQEFLKDIFPTLTNRDSLNAVTCRIAALSQPAFIRVVNSASERDPQWIVAHPVVFAQKPWGVVILPVSNSQVYSVFTDTVGKQLLLWGLFAVMLVLLMSTVVIIFYRWSRFLEEEVNHELTVVREAEGKYAKLFNEAVVGIFQTSSDGRLISANPSMAAMLGYESTDALIASDVFRTASGAERNSIPWEAVKNGAGADTPVAISKADGTVMNAIVHCKAVEGEAPGAIERYEGFIEDVTERKRLEQQLIQAQKLEGIGTLAGGIAHDFNNLLAMILGSAELMRLHSRDYPQLKRYVDRIVEASERGASISRQLLIFSRPDQAELAPVSLGSIITELEQMLTHFLPKSIAVETRTNAERCIIMGDAGHLHQAMLNLALNANDAMPKGGRLAIAEYAVDYDTMRKKFPACERGCYAAVSISDTGTGIDEAVRAKMFDPFFSTKERGKGTGLGLAIVHGIVKSHRGFIDVESVPHEGTTFTLYFPIIDDAAGSADHARRQDIVPNGDAVS